ncbi:ribosomal RNA small subunit methyltransferase A [Candidatus Parcubacteria bacterium]|nr:ribosomal RNA small subunit methyltransferase A [Candidatus Parcubacteria bacterium]
MDLCSKKDIVGLLKKYETAPIKYFGQNFLVNRGVVEKITAKTTQKDIVLEVGPGIGVITQELAKKARQVIAVEKSREMIEILKETLEETKNVKVVREDILELNLQSLVSNYKVVANLPFYLTSPVIRKFLEAENRPESMVLMMQKEVAQRICSRPPRMNLLAVSVQFYSQPKIMSYVSRGSFYPMPKVNSAIIEIIPCFTPKLPKEFFKIVKAGFSHPRKQLVNNLSGGLNLPKEKTASWLSENNIKPNQRAETLSLDDWKNLVNFKNVLL